MDSDKRFNNDRWTQISQTRLAPQPQPRDGARRKRLVRLAGTLAPPFFAMIWALYKRAKLCQEGVFDAKPMIGSIANYQEF
jgi:hypothetical protein